jgi:hypothetical protein
MAALVALELGPCYSAKGVFPDVCLRKRVAQRVRERGGNDEVGEREDRAR